MTRNHFLYSTIKMKLKDLFDKLLFFPMSMFLSKEEIDNLDAEYLETNAVIRELYNRPILEFSICDKSATDKSKT